MSNGEWEMRPTFDADSAMAGEQPAYRAYLLRLWQIRSGGRLEWRASLEDAHTGERLGFASLEQVLDFLKHATHGPDQPSDSRGD